MSECNENVEVPHCKHFVVRKKRYCRMTVKPGQTYCGEHMVPSSGDTNQDATLRVVCPLDPKHTCYANKLAKHLKICNARPKECPSYIVKGINCGNDPVIAGDNESITSRLLSNAATNQIRDVIRKINKIHSDLIENNITEKLEKHSVVEEELSNTEYGDKSKKHLIQTSSLVGLLEGCGLLQPNTCYVEFGAGKGHLSFWLSKAIEALEKSSVLLIERAAHRHKADNKLDKTEGRVHRIRADIADLVLGNVDIINTSSKVVGVTKHLCGEATDLALRCLGALEQSKEKVAGAVFAFCCHHRCQWSNYVGKPFFQEVDLTRTDFDIMCGMVSWATCGTGTSRDVKSHSAEEELRSTLKLNDRDQEIGLNRQEKAVVGKKCKQILNWGRLKYLEARKFRCKLHYYVDADISPENLCIVAYK